MLGWMKERIEEKRASKTAIWRTLVLAKDLAWIVSTRGGPCLFKRRVRRFFSKEPESFRYGLALCTFFRDEAPYLKEWIEFHRIVGVEKFFLYDNCSSDDFMSVLAPYIESGLVDLSSWPDEVPCREAHMDCVIKHENEARWIAFVNVDEFLFSPVADDLKEILSDYAAYPAVAVNHQIYGSCGHMKRPEGLQIESYTKKAPEDDMRHSCFKSIANPRRVLHVLNAHAFRCMDGFCVNEKKDIVGINNPWELNEVSYYSYPPSIEKLRINHYKVRSREECASKVIQRETGKFPVDFDDYWSGFDRNEVSDTAILRFASRLRRNMKNA